MQTIRAFIAIHLPADVQAYLGEISHSFSKELPAGAVRWVAPDRMHLTLRFLGETREDRLPAIGDALAEITAKHRPLTLHLDKLGCFPNSSRPRVIWVSLSGDADALQAIKTEIDAMLEPFGWQPEDRPFRAHLTLGRVKDEYKQIRLPWGHGVNNLPVMVSTIYIVQSRLLPDGPVYTDRYTAYFSAGTA